jgi:hypothetical protein
MGWLLTSLAASTDYTWLLLQPSRNISRITPQSSQSPRLKVPVTLLNDSDEVHDLKAEYRSMKGKLKA